MENFHGRIVAWLELTYSCTCILIHRRLSLSHINAGELHTQFATLDNRPACTRADSRSKCWHCQVTLGYLKQFQIAYFWM